MRCQNKLNLFCPEKQVIISSQDKPFITAELKVINTQKSREYIKRGRTPKYQALARKFDEKFKIEAKKYMEKNVEAHKESKPGQAYSTLQKMGAQPGDCLASNIFTLPNHESENLTEEQSAERIASHCAEISQEFPPLEIESLPPRFQTKLLDKQSPPVISEYDAYQKIKTAKKPKSGVPNDLPKAINQEFSPELSKPVARIINNISKSGKWPTQ